MYINNKLRDLAYKTSLSHGFWDNIRTYDDFVSNLTAEFQEVKDELNTGRSPTEVYYKNGNKPEGTPTELADIIIFILDYFGGSEPKIDVDESFLETPDEYYRNPLWYDKAKKKEPLQYFLEIDRACRRHISLSALYNILYSNATHIDENGQPQSVAIELHAVIKLIIEFCEIYEIDLEQNLINKINYNNTRPKDYRKVGTPKFLETDSKKVFNELLYQGFGMYKNTDSIVEERKRINDTVLGKRKARKELEDEER